MDDQQPADPATPELRLALAMRGGVSLAVWIGGSCAEIDELRRGAGFWGPLTEAAGYSAVVVDVMAGASAGGLNAVLFGASIRNGFPMKGLLDIWKRVASVDRLRRTEEPWLSLFDGDAAFLGVIRHHLREQIARHPDPRDPGYVDVQLSATLVEPLQVPAPSPEDERLWRARSSARFHFRHDTVTGIPRADFDPDPSTTARLALAARATSSFPGAFEPAVVRSTRPEAFGEGARPSSAEDLVDCRGVFSEARGRTTSSDAVVPEDFVVADGGIVDNIPLGKALEAVAG
ncbi:MAG TPA: patatin-like phospholipase family protein, partial [Acidimicrobiales bacterium]|nr:patatin-like phospholipase family protein [Acidimicrobiales bacterium]